MGQVTTKLLESMIGYESEAFVMNLSLVSGGIEASDNYMLTTWTNTQFHQAVKTIDAKWQGDAPLTG